MNCKEEKRVVLPRCLVHALTPGWSPRTPTSPPGGGKRNRHSFFFLFFFLSFRLCIITVLPRCLAHVVTPGLVSPTRPLGGPSCAQECKTDFASPPSICPTSVGDLFSRQLFNPPFTVVVDEGLLAIVTTVVALELHAMQQW